VWKSGLLARSEDVTKKRERHISKNMDLKYTTYQDDSKPRWKPPNPLPPLSLHCSRSEQGRAGGSVRVSSWQPWPRRACAWCISRALSGEDPPNPFNFVVPFSHLES